MRKIFILLFFPLQVFCQNTIGLPDLINYSKQTYKAGLQTWDFRQDPRGILYAANNEGLLSFDGKNWNTHPLPNKTIVRSVEMGENNRIYVGGQDELGYFEPSSKGLLQYHSLVKLLAPKDRNLGDVWDIIALNKQFFFRCLNKIIKISGETATIYNAPTEWTFLGYAGNQLFAQDSRQGLFYFDQNSWKPAITNNQIPGNDNITAILNVKADHYLVTTLKMGIFTLTSKTLTPISTPNQSYFQNARIYSAVTVGNDRFALATNNNGVQIIDQNGNLIQSFTKSEGLQNNNVLSIFLDTQQNLWLGLDNGIDFIAYNSAIRQINPGFLNASGYTALIHKNQLYVGTSGGLYSVPINLSGDLSFNRGNFNFVANTKGQAWGLNTINDQLFLGHHEGAFVINGNQATPLANSPGYWNFIPTSAIFPCDEMLAGNYKGLTSFIYENGSFKTASTIQGFTESSRFLALDKEGNIWVSHPYHGIYKINRSTKNEGKVETFGKEHGLPSLLNNHIFLINNEILVATEFGVYRYNSGSRNFTPDSFFQKYLGKTSVRYLKEDQEGNIWFIHEKSLGVIDNTQKEPSVLYLPELSNKLLSGFEYIYPVNKNNIFLAAETGIFHLNYEKYKTSIPKLQVHINAVKIVDVKDSLIFGGHASNADSASGNSNGSAPKISYRFRNIRISYASPLFAYQNTLEYSYRLKGYESNWSEWTNRTEKEYTNLPIGNYVFEVKVRNNLGNESVASSYAFSISPPWYASIWAMAFYLLLLFAGIRLLYKWQKKKFIQQQIKHDLEQKRLSYIHDLEINKAESELMLLRNEKLEADINYKNTELATTAMHLVKKGELINKIKSELMHVMKSIDNTQAIAELKKMMKALSEDDNIDKEWDNFSKHFDKVHSDFLVTLKEIHPSITPNELKLSAYLRMNLSTKEIAQLMNISVRGVEISRYRLRKKLAITTDQSLFDYLISIQYGKSDT